MLYLTLGYPTPGLGYPAHLGLGFPLSGTGVPPIWDGGIPLVSTGLPVPCGGQTALPSPSFGCGRKKIAFVGPTTFPKCWGQKAKPRTKVTLFGPPKISREQFPISFETINWYIHVFLVFLSSEIPKLLHQIWNDEHVPDKWKSAIDSCRRMNPDYTYKLWTMKEIEKLVRKEYGWFSTTFTGESSHTRNRPLTPTPAGLVPNPNPNTSPRCLPLPPTLAQLVPNPNPNPTPRTFP